MSSATRSRGVPASKMYGAITHIASSRVIVERALSAAPTSLVAGTTCVPPQAVQPRISERTRDGWFSASSCASIPPIEAPNTCADSRPAASITARASSAITGIGYGPGGTSLRPTPRLS